MAWILNGDQPADVFVKEQVMNEHTQYTRYQFYDNHGFSAGYIDFHPGIYLAFRFQDNATKEY